MVDCRALGSSLGGGLALPLRDPFFCPSILAWSRPHFHIQMKDFSRLGHDLGDRFARVAVVLLVLSVNFKPLSSSCRSICVLRQEPHVE